MAYQVLARKYRPQRFADVAGQEHVTRTLKNALQQQRIAHGYIFSGHRGIGKTTIARILAMALDCRSEVGSAERPDVEPCLQCVSCREISSGGNAESVATQSFDFIEIDAASNRGIDDVRSICSQATVRPARDRYKIFLLDEAHQITDAAFNAILKTLEEPPEWAIFMMATTEPENIPQTIRSRCQHFSFHAVRFEDILTQLRTIAVQESIDCEDEALALLAEAGDGSMRDALSIMDQAIASAPRRDGRPQLDAALVRELMGALPNAVIERLFATIHAGESAALMQELDRLLTSGNSPVAIARQMVRYLRNALMASLGGEQTSLLQIAAEERARAARTAALFSEEELTRHLQLLLRTFDDLSFRQEQRFHLELGLLKLVHAQRLVPMEQVLSGLAQTGNAPGNNAASAASRPGPSASSSARSTAPTSGATTSAASSATTGATTAAPGHAAKPAASPAANPASGPATSPAQPTLSPFASGTAAPTGSAPPTAAGQAAHSPMAVTTTATVLATEGALARAAGPQLVPRMMAEAVATAVAEPVLAPVIAPVSEQISGQSTQQIPEQITELVQTPPRVDAIPEPTAAPMANAGTDAAAASDAPTAAETEAGLEAVKAAVVQALDSGGHSSAASLLDVAAWIADGASLRIEVPAKATMIRLTFNANAEKLIRQALTQAGATPRYRIVPGDSSVAVAPRASASAGSVDQEARNHPLVLKSTEIFDAEICSVIDLRPK